MRARCALLILAVALAACGSSSADSSSRSVTGPGSTTSTAAQSTTASGTASAPTNGLPARCGPTAARTLAASGVARVYQAGSVVYGCAVSSQKRIRLGNSQLCVGSERVSAVAVAGFLTAYGSERCGVDTGSASLVVRRLTDGTQLRSLAATGTSTGPESYTTVTSVVVKSTGSVAWIAVGGSIISHRRVIEVHAEDAHGSHLLDHGATIDQSSLRLRGSQLTWRAGGMTRSAVLH